MASTSKVKEQKEARGAPGSAEPRATGSAIASDATRGVDFRSIDALVTRKVLRHTITQARSRLPELVKRAAGGGTPVAIGKQGEEEAILLSFTDFQALARRVVDLSSAAGLGQLLAENIAKRLLPDAPPHIVLPQVKELASLSLDDLALLLPIMRLPVSPEQRAKLRAIRGGEVLERLERRHAIARTIAEASKAGLYDALEHRTGETDVWSDDDDEPEETVEHASRAGTKRRSR